ncbi:MAG: transposase [Pedobacter sp.]|jgi:REP element-mobilizing transposase RayT
MPYVKIWIHCVWGTKNRIRFLSGNKKGEVINHILTNAREKGIYIDFINGHTEHLHCLLSLNQDQTLSKVMQLIKGESSFWINRNSIIEEKFEWAEEYFGVSVSESHVNRVREYIKNQEQHHYRKSWQEECDEFMEKYGFNLFYDK